ncbi:MAG: AAA family ATPase, partial [Clostridia bacterium]|nr:AAA family ATPase [Clostridia bacterium]
MLNGGFVMRIERTKYLQELIDRKHNGLVKVITGIRRCGKSYLLFNLFYEHLIAEGVKKENIIKLELDQTSNIKYRNPFELDKYVREQIKDNGEMHYIFLDEIQFVEKVKNPYVENGAEITFYDVLNGLIRIRNADIYVTGSNSKMLSTDILTEFRGRGDEVRVHPLVFSEYMQVYDGDKYDGWLDYYT